MKVKFSGPCPLYVYTPSINTPPHPPGPPFFLALSLEGWMGRVESGRVEEWMAGKGRNGKGKRKGDEKEKER